MDFTNEINTLESEKLRLGEMLKRNNDRLQLLKEASTEPSSDGYRRFFKLKGYSLLYTGGERLNHERFIFNCTLVSTAGHLSRKYWNVEELSKKLEGAKEISKEEFIKWATEYQQRKINSINSDYTQLFKHINSIPDDGKEHLVSDLCGEQFCFNMFRTKAGRDELLITKIKVNNGIIMFYVNSKKQWYYYEDLGESKWYAYQLINYLDLTKFMHKDEGYK